MRIRIHLLRYRCGSWTLDPTSERNIEAFEMYLYCKILRISWTQKLTNVEVLNIMQNIHLIIKNKTKKYLGHGMR